MPILSSRASLSARAFGMMAQPQEPTTDPYIANVKLLMHMEGANGSTTFTDEKGHVATPHGSAQISTASPLYETSSALFAVATIDYLTFANTTDFVFAGDFTIEFTIKLVTSGGNQQLIGNYVTNTVGHWACRTQGANNSLIWYINGAGTFTGNTGIYTAGQVLKIALVRSGSTCTMYVNGVVLGTPTTYSGNMGLSTNSLAIGAVSNATLPFGGYMDEVRITDGVARYTANYTPRNTRFPNS